MMWVFGVPLLLLVMVAGFVIWTAADMERGKSAMNARYIAAPKYRVVPCEVNMYRIEEKMLSWFPWGCEMKYLPTGRRYKTVFQAQKQIKHLERVI